MAKVFSIKKDNWYVCVISAHNHNGGVAFTKDKIYQSPKDEYLVRDDNGQPEIIGAFMMEYFRPWTIKDAKPGDFLTYITDDDEKWYFIFRSEYKPYDCQYHYYAGFAEEFIPGGTGCLDDDSFRPSTSQEKELLLSKIKENGYIWDAENCELINTTVIKSKGKKCSPSLTEIKDERIRKWLIRLIETAGYRELETDPMPYKRMDVIAWLKKQKAADCITYAIGEKEVPMATMDDDQRTNEGIEELAKFIRGHLAEIPENAQKEFERIYTKTTGKKMYGGFKD